MKRSDFLKSAAALAGLSVSLNPYEMPASAQQAKALRVVHFTDTHIFDDAESINGTERAIDKINNLKPLPDLVLFGGDNIMDALHTEREKVKLQWKLFHEHATSKLKVPYFSCIGNHDVFGWDLDSVEKTDSLYGKKWAMDEMNMPEHFYSFDRDNWHFIILDSIHIGDGGKGYYGKLDEQQMEWLSSDLKAAKSKHVLILSHMPIVSICPVFHPSSLNEAANRFEVAATWMHIDGQKLKDLFFDSKNVKLCISGHTHMQDSITFHDTHYLNNGAVCGNWWKGTYQNFDPAFVILDLLDDGSFKRQVINY